MRIWDEFVSQQETAFGKKVTDEWIRSLTVLRFDARNIYLKARDYLHLNWVKEHLSPLFQELKNQSGSPIKVHLTLEENRDKTKAINTSAPARFEQDIIDPSSTLYNLISTEENELIFTLLDSLFSTPTFNPLFVYGPTATGKTHLLMAIAAKAKERGLNAFYVKAESFTRHVVGAIQYGTMQEFRKIYRAIDLLLIDDIHILARKAATQEEFFHTFNSLHAAGKQIVITANNAPKDLEHIEPRLISRFEWGISLPIDKYSRNSLHKILQEKAKRERFTLSVEVINYLLDTFKPTSLFLALQALLLREESAVDVARVKNALHDLLEKEGKKRVTSDDILRIVASHYEVSMEDLLGTSRQREFSHPRKIAIYLLRTLLQLPLLRIGEIFKRDHSTILTSVRSIENNRDEVIEKILSQIQE